MAWQLAPQTLDAGQQHQAEKISNSTYYGNLLLLKRQHMVSVSPVLSEIIFSLLLNMRLALCLGGSYALLVDLNSR